MSYLPLENYGIVGDLHTVALVGMNGSIDFMCFPRFDSPSIFAALLDERKGGYFSLAPTLDKMRHRQLYLPDTNILLTRFLSQDGVAEVSDFMPVEEVTRAHTLIRRARTVRGEIKFRMTCAPRFDYARGRHRINLTPEGAVFTPMAGNLMPLRLRTTVPLAVRDGDAVAEFKLGAGQYADFILEPAADGGDSPACAAGYVPNAFKETMNFWRRWVGRSTYTGRWRETVNRSGLILKLLTSQDFGSIVAAPTFGVPELIGGARNWDYRYAWIRDASFSVYALMRLGYTEETAAFMNWLESRFEELEPDGSLQLMYGIDGRHELPEEELTHLEGYMKSSPVRIGNDAVHQLQLDIAGEAMDAVYLYDKYGHPISYKFWRNVLRLVDWVCQNWHREDESIWEVRSGTREFLYSRVMCWVAIDRALRLAQKRSFPAPTGRWAGARDAIYLDVMNNFRSAEAGYFVQHKGSAAIDASCLIMPLVRIISPVDPFWLSTLRVVTERLLDDSLVFRYDTDDGLSGKEGTFSLCSFWYIECLSRAGDLRQARLIFEKMLGYANHLGLYSEELGPSTEHLGNFPQAFSHVALISAAYDLNRRLSGASFGSTEA
jgi:GH15 family glucan-1,4-alpha-glucosidase